MYLCYDKKREISSVCVVDAADPRKVERVFALRGFPAPYLVLDELASNGMNKPVYRYGKGRKKGMTLLYDKFIARALEEKVIDPASLEVTGFAMSSYDTASEGHYLTRLSRVRRVGVMPIVQRAMNFVENLIMQKIREQKAVPYSFERATEYAELSNSAGTPWVENGYHRAKNLLTGTDTLPSQSRFLASYFDEPTSDVLYKVIHKEEALKIKKIAEGRQRYVVNVPKELYIAQLKLQPAIFLIEDAFTQQDGFLFKLDDTKGNWQYLYEYLGPGKIYEMDLHDCDTTEDVPYMQWYFTLLGRITGCVAYAQRLFEIIVNRTIILPSGLCYQVYGGNPSGNAYTFNMNTLINFVLLCASIMSQNNLSNEKLLQYYYCGVFKFLIGGDDVVYIDTPLLHFDPKQHQNFLAQCGFETEVECTDRNHVEVMGRGFVKVKRDQFELVVPIYRRKMLVQLQYVDAAHYHNIFYTFQRVCSIIDKVLLQPEFEVLHKLANYLMTQREWRLPYAGMSAANVLPAYHNTTQLWELYSPLEAKSQERSKN